MHPLQPVKSLRTKDPPDSQQEMEAFLGEIFPCPLQSVILGPHSIIIDGSFIEQGIQVELRPFDLTFQPDQISSAFRKEVIQIILFVLPQMKLF